MTKEREVKRDVTWIREALAFLEKGGSVGELVSELTLMDTDEDDSA